jgi:hypothetical protein
MLSNIKALNTGEIKGINKSTPVYFWLWSLWNVYYFFALEQPLSFIFSVLFMVVSGMWMYLVLMLEDK